jgi:hypothetical protein
MVRVLRVNDHGPIEPPAEPEKEKKAHAGHDQHRTAEEQASPNPKKSQNGPSTGNPESITDTEEMTE